MPHIITVSWKTTTSCMYLNLNKELNCHEKDVIEHIKHIGE